MKELVVISGKGGTGKTSVAAALAILARQAVIADCDVDAADLHLLLQPQKSESQVFRSGHVAMVDTEACIGCGTCMRVCRFEAIQLDPVSGKAVIDPLACEGCGACTDVCLSSALWFEERECGRWLVSQTRAGTLVHARLNIGAENSGKLVSLVRKKARSLAEEQKVPWIIVDGPPGTGCAVIASITNADAVLVVAEATVSGQHDWKRVAQLAQYFKIPLFVCVNRGDIHPLLTAEIEAEALVLNAQFLGTIPYDQKFNQAQWQGLTIVETQVGPASLVIRSLWDQIQQQFKP